MFIKLYKTLVRSHLEYENTILAPSFKEPVNSYRKRTKKRYKDFILLRKKNMTYTERLKIPEITHT